MAWGKLIQINGKAALVEYVGPDGDLNRVVVPTAALKGKRCPPDELERGIPWGQEWSKLVQPDLKATAERIEQELRRVGIWTVEDLYHNPQAAHGAIIAAYGVDFAALIRAAKGG